MGREIRLEKFPTVDSVRQAFIRGKIDITILWPEEIIEVTKAGGKIFPWAAYTVDGKRKRAECLWQAKGAALKNISEITGKTLVGGEYELNVFHLISLREYLSQNGMDKPLWHVFKSFTVVPGNNSAFMSVAMGKFDFMWTNEDNKISLKIMNPTVASKLTFKFCTEKKFGRGILVFNKKKLTKAEMDFMRGYLKDADAKMAAHAKTDTAMQQVRTYIKMAKAKIVPANDDENAGERELFKKARANGWLTEAEFIYAKLAKATPGEPVVVKPDYTFCKKACPTKKDKEKCIVKCLGE